MKLLQQRRDSDTRGGGNGGFPDPPAGEPVRVVRRAHAECGAETRIRLPASLPESVVHRVVCDGCRRSFETGRAAAPAAPPASVTAAVFADAESTDHRAEAPSEPAAARATSGATVDDVPGEPALPTSGSAGSERRPPDWLQGRLWPWVSFPLALLAVLLGLSAIQGDDRMPEPIVTPAAGPGAAAEAKFIEQPGYSLSLPAGWSRVDPPDGAVFAARSADGNADATLWIEREPNLSMDEFEQRSLAQLAEIGENPRVVDRVEAPTLEGTIVELRADTTIDDDAAGPYRVTLRGAGPFRHYLATSQRPGADPALAADVELLHTSLRPDVEIEGLD